MRNVVLGLVTFDICKKCPASAGHFSFLECHFDWQYLMAYEGQLRNAEGGEMARRAARANGPLPSLRLSRSDSIGAEFCPSTRGGQIEGVVRKREFNHPQDTGDRPSSMGRSRVRSDRNIQNFGNCGCAELPFSVSLFLGIDPGPVSAYRMPNSFRGFAEIA